MNHLLKGFADELVKIAGIGSFVMKHPLSTLGGGFVVGSAALAAHQGRKSGRELSGTGRYLGATPGGASDAAYQNYNAMFGKHRKSSNKEVAALSKNYKPSLFTRGGANPGRHPRTPPKEKKVTA